MKRNSQLNRSQKVALLSQLVEGNTAPIMQLKQAQNAPFAYILDATQTIEESRSVLDERPDDPITNIVLTSSFDNGQPNKSTSMPDMTRAAFTAWHLELRSQRGGTAVVCLLRTYYANPSAPSGRPIYPVE